MSHFWLDAVVLSVAAALAIRRKSGSNFVILLFSWPAKDLFCFQASPDDYGHYPDPLEHATGREKKMLLARLAGDDVSSCFSSAYISLC